jgi:hypothetical protein
VRKLLSYISLADKGLPTVARTPHTAFATADKEGLVVGIGSSICPLS